MNEEFIQEVKIFAVCIAVLMAIVFGIKYSHYKTQRQFLNMEYENVKHSRGYIESIESQISTIESEIEKVDLQLTVVEDSATRVALFNQKQAQVNKLNELNNKLK